MANANNSSTALTKSQLQHWQDFGYIVVPNIIDSTLCQAARQLVFDVIGAALQRPDSWYQSNDKLRGIMVQSVDHAIQTQIRQSPKFMRCSQRFGKIISYNAAATEWALTHLKLTHGVFLGPTCIGISILISR